MFVFCDLETTNYSITVGMNDTEYLPDIERIEQQRERQFKKKMLAELPRRTSDRIAIKAAQRIEEVRERC